MNKKIIFILIIAAFVAAAVFCPAVSARYTADGQESKGIDSGDLVFLGEENLDFSKFEWNGYTADSLMPNDKSAVITITNGKASIPANQKTGLYFAFNYTLSLQDNDQGFIMALYCTVADPSGYSFTLDVPAVAETGDTKEIVLTGKPYKEYVVTISPIDGPQFSDGTYTKTITLGTSGKQTLSITVPDTAKTGSYTISAKEDGGETISQTIKVTLKKTTVTLTFDFVSDEVRNGLFAVGDVMYLTGKLDPQPEKGAAVQPFYMFITGRGLPENGENLDGIPVVDGDTSTFTIVEYDTEKGCFEYYWDTNGFEPGMYTLHIAFQPIGFAEGTAVGGVGSASQEISLSDKSIHVKFAEENGGLFTQGDYVYSYWSARGSPTGVRWYIIGPNFLETGVNTNANNWLYTKDQELGKSAPQGLYGFTYDRIFSNDIAPGNYYLVYQHPGFNREFDVNPNNENGYFTSLTTNFGESASLEGRPSSNCAEALETLINSAASDDLCVITDITIEPPYISIDQVEHLEIGEALKIKGTTNYAGEGVTADGTEVKNTLSLKVNRLDFDLAEENAAMQLQIVSRVVPQNIIPYYGERTFEFAEIDTSTWFEGTYQAVVTNIDTGFEESIMFTVGGEGFEADSSTLNVPSNPTEEPYEELEPLPPIERYEEPTEPEEPKSPGFILAPLALGLAVILRRK